MNLCLIVIKLLFLPFVHVYSCWDMVACCNLFQDVTTFSFLFLAEARKSCTYTPEQYALQGSFLGNPSRQHRNKRGVFSTSFLWMRTLSLRCLTSCQACIFQVCDKHLCLSDLRADQPKGFGKKHHRKCLIKLNKDEFL